MGKDNTSLGLNENVEALLCYVLGWLTGIIFLLLEKKNRFVRFHAMQSLVVFLALFVISLVVEFIPIVGPLLSILILPVSLVLWVLLMFKAYQGERYKLPWIGDFAESKA